MLRFCFSYHEKKGNQHNINVPIIMPNKFQRNIGSLNNQITITVKLCSTYQVFEQPCVHVETL